MTFSRTAAVFVLALALLPRVALAHPVAMGNIEVVIHGDKVLVTVRSSVEEVTVAHSLRVDETTQAYAPKTLKDAYEKHGAYLLKHLDIRANGHTLKGNLVKTTPPQAEELDPLEVQKNFVGFEFEFAIPRDSVGGAVEQLCLMQTVLEGFMYAPGNMWEAVYVLRIRNSAQEMFETSWVKPGMPACFNTTTGRIEAEGVPMQPKEPKQRPPAATKTGTEPTDPSRQPPPLEQRGEGVTEKIVTAADTRVDIWQTMNDRARDGIHHILVGYDHLLFVAALTLAVLSFWDLVKVITAFTLAHTLTLTLSVLVPATRLPSGFVEPMIAASIVFVALQNVFFPAKSRGAVRLLAAFGFGLFHGLGYAGGMLHAMEGMPATAIGASLVAFSIGVEIGHQLIVLPFFALLMLGRKKLDTSEQERPFTKLSLRYGSVIISIAGLYYLVFSLMGD